MCDCCRMCYNTAKQQVEVTDSLYHLRISHCHFPVHYTVEDREDRNVFFLIFFFNVFDPIMQEYNDPMHVDITVLASNI